MDLRTGDTVFYNWKIKRLIGNGNFGMVYEIEREEFGHVYHAAAKVIQISKERFYSDDMLGEEITQEDYIEYYRSLVEDVVEECALMERMKGDSHIVSYEDHQIEQREDGSWIIYIRMELLKPFRAYMVGKNFTNRDVIQLGIDLCMALESCQKFNIIHRDIKPENIFVSETGSFKLGDFGISKVLSVSEIAMSRKGTQLYMAPEVYRGEQYDSTVDIYSLGLVLFRLMNDNRLPFFPLAPQPIRYRDNEIALQKRLSGLDVPVPCNALGRLGEIIQKACKYEPAERYASPKEMRRDLEAILYDSIEQKNVYPNGEDVLNQKAFMTTMAEKEMADEPNGTVGVFIHKNKAEKKTEEQQRQEEERKQKVLYKEEGKVIEERKQGEESDESENQTSEIDKLEEQKKVAVEIKAQALRQQQSFQYKSEEEAAKQLMIRQIEEKRHKEEEKNRRNKIIFAVLFILVILYLNYL